MKFSDIEIPNNKDEIKLSSPEELVSYLDKITTYIRKNNIFKRAPAEKFFDFVVDLTNAKVIKDENSVVFVKLDKMFQEIMKKVVAHPSFASEEERRQLMNYVHLLEHSLWVNKDIYSKMISFQAGDHIAPFLEKLSQQKWIKADTHKLDKYLILLEKFLKFVKPTARDQKTLIAFGKAHQQMHALVIAELEKDKIDEDIIKRYFAIWKAIPESSYKSVLTSGEITQFINLFIEKAPIEDIVTRGNYDLIEFIAFHKIDYLNDYLEIIKTILLLARRIQKDSSPIELKSGYFSLRIIAVLGQLAADLIVHEKGVGVSYNLETALDNLDKKALPELYGVFAKSMGTEEDLLKFSFFKQYLSKRYPKKSKEKLVELCKLSYGEYCVADYDFLKLEYDCPAGQWPLYGIKILATNDISQTRALETCESLRYLEDNFLGLRKELGLELKANKSQCKLGLYGFDGLRYRVYWLLRDYKSLPNYGFYSAGEWKEDSYFGTAVSMGDITTSIHEYGHHLIIAGGPRFSNSFDHGHVYPFSDGICDDSVIDRGEQDDLSVEIFQALKNAKYPDPGIFTLYLINRETGLYKELVLTDSSDPLPLFAATPNNQEDFSCFIQLLAVFCKGHKDLPGRPSVFLDPIVKESVISGVNIGKTDYHFEKIIAGDMREWNTWFVPSQACWLMPIFYQLSHHIREQPTLFEVDDASFNDASRNLVSFLISYVKWKKPKGIEFERTAFNEVIQALQARIMKQLKIPRKKIKLVEDFLILLEEMNKPENDYLEDSRPEDRKNLSRQIDAVSNRYPISTATVNSITTNALDPILKKIIGMDPEKWGEWFVFGSKCQCRTRMLPVLHALRLQIQRVNFFESDYEIQKFLDFLKKYVEFPDSNKATQALNEVISAIHVRINNQASFSDEQMEIVEDYLTFLSAVIQSKLPGVTLDGKYFEELTRSIAEKTTLTIARLKKIESLLAVSVDDIKSLNNYEYLLQAINTVKVWVESHYTEKSVEAEEAVSILFRMLGKLEYALKAHKVENQVSYDLTTAQDYLESLLCEYLCVFDSLVEDVKATFLKNFIGQSYKDNSEEEQIKICSEHPYYQYYCPSGEKALVRNRRTVTARTAIAEAEECCKLETPDELGQHLLSAMHQGDLLKSIVLLGNGANPNYLDPMANQEDLAASPGVHGRLNEPESDFVCGTQINVEEKTAENFPQDSRLLDTNKTPLYLLFSFTTHSKLRCHPSLLKALVEHGASLLDDDENGEQLRKLAAGACEAEQLEIVKPYIDKLIYQVTPPQEGGSFTTSGFIALASAGVMFVFGGIIYLFAHRYTRGQRVQATAVVTPLLTLADAVEAAQDQDIIQGSVCEEVTVDDVQEDSDDDYVTVETVEETEYVEGKEIKGDGLPFMETKSSGYDDNKTAHEIPVTPNEVNSGLTFANAVGAYWENFSLQSQLIFALCMHRVIFGRKSHTTSEKMKDIKLSMPEAVIAAGYLVEKVKETIRLCAIDAGIGCQNINKDFHDGGKKNDLISKLRGVIEVGNLKRILPILEESIKKLKNPNLKQGSQFYSRVEGEIKCLADQFSDTLMAGKFPGSNATIASSRNRKFNKNSVRVIHHHAGQLFVNTPARTELEQGATRGATLNVSSSTSNNTTESRGECGFDCKRKQM